MKIAFLGLLAFQFFIAFAQTEPSIHDLKRGRVENDTSYIYSLPWQKGAKHLLVQAYQSKFSHRGEMALDFKMKRGTLVCAARSGIVVSAREDSKTGGLKQENLSDGNYIIILHDDNSHAHYWHLDYEGVLVNIGDTVLQGQQIGYSGNTGYTAFPHLHFEVTSGDSVGTNQVPTRFRTSKGVRYLRPLKRYRSI